MDGQQGSSIDPQLVVGHELKQLEFEYTERDVALYALAVGAAADNATDPLELPLVFNKQASDSIKTLPSFGVLFIPDFTQVLQTVPGMRFDPALLLHGEQYLELLQPLPTHGKVLSRSRITGVHDKGKGAVVEAETVSSEAETGARLCINRTTLFIRGAGGFAKRAGMPAVPPPKAAPKARGPQRAASETSAPTYTHTQRTAQSQALLYRLLGDYNPLHADPELAEAAGFERPILHGLCTLGFAVRAVIRCCCNGDTSAVRSIQARFLKHVFPGETLQTDMWHNPSENRVEVRTTVVERAAVVLSAKICIGPVAPARL